MRLVVSFRPYELKMLKRFPWFVSIIFSSYISNNCQGCFLSKSEGLLKAICLFPSRDRTRSNQQLFMPYTDNTVLAVACCSYVTKKYSPCQSGGIKSLRRLQPTRYHSIWKNWVSCSFLKLWTFMAMCKFCDMAVVEYFTWTEDAALWI